MTLSIMTLSITIFQKATLIVTRHNITSLLSVVMLNIINKPIMLSVVMLSVVMLGVVAPRIDDCLVSQ
jgi:hypothetical protein